MELQFIEKLKIKEELKQLEAKELIDSAISVGFILKRIRYIQKEKI